jgi:hypothetical protein
MLGRQQPGLESCDGSLGEFPPGFRPFLFSARTVVHDGFFFSAFLLPEAFGFWRKSWCRRREVEEAHGRKPIEFVE